MGPFEQLIKKFIHGKCSLSEEEKIIKLYKNDREFKKELDKAIALKNMIDDSFPLEDDMNKQDESDSPESMDINDDINLQ